MRTVQSIVLYAVNGAHGYELWEVGTERLLRTTFLSDVSHFRPHVFEEEAKNINIKESLICCETNWILSAIIIFCHYKMIAC